MSAVFRNVTRTIKNATETTLETQTPSNDTLAFNLLTSDKFYIGFKERFTTRYFHFGTLNATTSAVSVKYWNGTSFQAVKDLVDQTVGMTRSGFVSWTNESDWKAAAQTPVDDVELFWVEVSVGTNLDAGTTLQSLLNLFNDDVLLRQYYPELITDTRYLPVGAVDFIDQYVAAKNKIVHRLKSDGLIKDESQIIDINEVSIAAAHAAAYIILMPIATDEVNQERAGAALNAMNDELNQVKMDLDFNDSGVIDDNEKNAGNIVLLRG